MIMDGLDTLSQVALADQLNLSFDSYHAPSSTTAASVLRSMDEDNLNTPVTTSSDVNFSFAPPDLELSQEALPITGEFSFYYANMNLSQLAMLFFNLTHIAILVCKYVRAPP